MKTNLTLIGMPGAGKSTIGIILAKNMGFGFVDTDILIQINRQKTLQEIIDESDHLNLRRIEEQEVLKLNIRNQIISTGGSVIYSQKVMEHLAQISKIIYLDVSFENINKRIHNFETRGIAKDAAQSFEDLYIERTVLYRKYAEIAIDCNHLNQDELANKIASIV